MSPFEVTNTTLGKDQVALIKALKFPDGVYKIILRFYNKHDSNMFSTNVSLEVVDKMDKDF